MIVTKKALSRRTFLRGMGAALGLPLLDAMFPALGRAAGDVKGPIKRMGFVYTPNGAAMQYWTPKTQGAAYELSPSLAPLAPYRDRFLTLSGLAHPQAEPLGDGNGDHSRASATWLNGVHPRHSEGADVQAGITADQIAASVLGKDTQLPSLELAIDLDFLVGNCENGYSCVYMNTVSWKTPNSPLPMENNPRVVFERLFGHGGTPAQRMARMGTDRSILDSVASDLLGLKTSLGAGDRGRVDQYLDAVRSIERRIQIAEANSADRALPPLERPAGAPGAFEEHVRLMFDLLALAFQADVTRVFTLMLGRELGGRTYPQIGVTDPHHGLSHHRNVPASLEKLSRIDKLHVGLFAHFLERLQSTPEGAESLLDNSLVLYGGGLGDGNDHAHFNLPIVLAGGAGGRVKGGRHLMYPKDTPMTNLLVSMLDTSGVEIERLGDSTGRLAELKTLSGV